MLTANSGVTLSPAAGDMTSPLEPCEQHAAGGRDALSGGLQRLLAVPGNGPNRVNDLLLLRPQSGEEAGNRHVVFFHGDIQNFQEQMSAQPEGSRWLCWSLEEVALLLGRRFPDRHVWVVRASRFHLHKFSCFHNFVESNSFGAPEHSGYSEQVGAFRHLRALLVHAMQRAQLPRPPSPHCVDPGFSLVLVAFSKGCVVLNQMTYELAGARCDPVMAPFVERISDMFWLDGGHPGGSETWVTDQRALRELAASGVSVHAHVTPYEVRDPMRAWVGREYEHFIQTLEELGARPRSQLHFLDQPASILNHFRVLLHF